MWKELDTLLQKGNAARKVYEQLNGNDVREHVIGGVDHTVSLL